MTRLSDALRERILVLDGAMGTMIQAAALTADDFGGASLDGCNEHLNLTRPDVIRAIHAAYFDAGADCVSTNTFGCAPYVLGEYGLADRAYEISKAAAMIAKETGPGFVIGAMGPSTRSISVTRNVTFQEVMDAYEVQAAGLIAGGADALLLETQQDTLNLKAAAIGVKKALRAAGADLPLMVSGTIEPTGTMLAGQGVEALYVALEHLDLLSIGLNCATGPEFMTDHLRSLAAIATRFVTVYPNAGLPDERGQYGETPQSLAFKMKRFVDEGWVNLIGGCCGTTPAHIRSLADLARGRPARVPASAEPQAVSGVEVFYPSDDNRPLFVGERTNVIGSRRFKTLIVNEQFEEAAEIGRAQVKNSAQVLDVCLANPDRDLVFDALVFPVGTGDANYTGSAVETIEGIRAIKQRFPECKTILGISNVSFGLPAAGREVLNSVFLFHATKAGLDYAIVNTEGLQRYPSIPEEEKQLAEDLIFIRGEDPVAAFAAAFRERKKP